MIFEYVYKKRKKSKYTHLYIGLYVEASSPKSKLSLS